MKIFRFPMEIIDEQILEIPAGAKILAVQTKVHQPCIWALCDDKASIEYRRILIYETGHEIDITGLQYLGTFQIKNLAEVLVFHVFEGYYDEI